MLSYRAPWWLAGSGALGGNLQTIWPALFSEVSSAAHAPDLSYRRERVDTPDGDFIDIDWLAQPQDKGAHPLLIMFHGLEGSSRSHYAQAFAHWAQAQGWSFAVPHFRGCSGELNRAPRSYHLGDHEEVGWMLEQLASRHKGPTVALGVSLGGNALLRWAQEAGSQASHCVRAVAAVSAPLDLAAAGMAIGQGFNRWVYNRMFLRGLKPKALAKLQQFPGLVDLDALRAAQDLYSFDNAFTAPVHGFANTEDYWARCSAGPRLRDIAGVPALVLNARNDPFIPPDSLPLVQEVGNWVTLWRPNEGGHVGFPAGPLPGHVATLPQAAGAWLAQHL